MKQLLLPFPTPGGGFPYGVTRPSEPKPCANCGKDGRWIRDECSVCFHETTRDKRRAIARAKREAYR